VDSCLLVAEHDIELRLNLFAAIARETAVSQNLQRVTAANYQRRAHGATTLASSLLRACSVRILLPNSSKRPLKPASKAAADAAAGEEVGAAVRTWGWGLLGLASASLDMSRELG
jgi:hypothetical protein